MSFTLVREHRVLGSETSIWPRLTASNAVNYHILVTIYPAADLRIRVVSCHELLGQSYLIPQVCPIRILSRFLVHSRSTRHLKTPFATNMFALSLPSFSLVALLLTVCPSSIKIQAYPLRAWPTSAYMLVHLFQPTGETGFIYLWVL